MLGQLNKEEQVQVVIRLKPVPKEQIATRSVYVSDEQDKTLVVETPNKKEYFVFDNIADDQCSQQEIYQYIGQDAVKSSIDGYNCCIFAYGQTGTGKSYSILGNSYDTLNDIYAQSRGILPRLLSDLFSWCENETNRFWIKCSYLEIYNEQIIDLLNPDLKLRQIREDFKKGVFVEGLSQENATNYEDAMAILMRGVKNRKTSATAMNDQSSRSHTIFTLNIESEIVMNDITKTRRSKINIVDLAGSERAKQTKVDGDRLKQGCNINRSLHVLGNVINALVQSAKKKKHIPFRDSKLTHFLKDSLSGNSITKLLANIHPSKAYLGDTLSTLMFAKRAKILKMKVEVNENMTQNFQQLRKQIRKLRQELAEARYIKNQDRVDQNINQSETQQQNSQRIIDVSQMDYGKQEKVLQIFQQNQKNYKSLIEIYEEHLKNCTMANKGRKSLNMHQEWKNLQKKNIAYCNLLKGMPAFTKIFKQNMRLKKNKERASPLKQKSQTFKSLLSSCNLKQECLVSPNLVNKIKLDYEVLIKSIETKFMKYVEELQLAYEDLEHQNRQKEDKIKQLKKRKELPPDLEELANDNQYLKLNILQLQDQINSYEEKQRKLLTEVKELKKQKQLLEEKLDESCFQTFFPKLVEIRQSFEKQLKQHEDERNSMISYIDNMRQSLISSVQGSKNLSESLEILKQENRGLKRKLNQLLKISDEMEITKDQNTNTFWTNEESNISEQFQIFNQKNKFLDKDPKIEFQSEEQKLKGIDLSNQITKLHRQYNEQIKKLKQEIKNLQRASKQQLHHSKSNIKPQIETQENFTSELCVQEPVIVHTRCSRTLGKFKEPDTVQYISKYGFNQQKDGHSAKGSPQSVKVKKSKGADDRYPK